LIFTLSHTFVSLCSNTTHIFFLLLCMIDCVEQGPFLCPLIQFKSAQSHSISKWKWVLLHSVSHHLKKMLYWIQEVTMKILTFSVLKDIKFLYNSANLGFV
jgi:hypothetical protein